MEELLKRIDDRVQYEVNKHGDHTQFAKGLYTAKQLVVDRIDELKQLGTALTIPPELLVQVLSELDALEWDKDMTPRPEGNPALWILLNELKKKTGVSLDLRCEVSWEMLKKDKEE